LFNVFSFPIVLGDRKNPLKNPDSIVLSQKMVDKYFGNEDPIGKIISLDKKTDFIVSAVFLSPDNSDIEFEFYLPFNALNRFGYSADEFERHWQALNYQTFVRLKKNIDPGIFEGKISGLVKENLPERKWYLGMQELSKVHLYNTDGSWANMKYVAGFSLVGVFIVIIAIINFTNLSLSKTNDRAKEIGLRKTVGATQKQLVAQFIVESSIMVLLSLIFALLVAVIFTPVLFKGLHDAVSFSIFNGKILFFLFAIWLFTSVTSTVYPAFVLANINPSLVIQGEKSASHGNASHKQLLVAMQFFISIGLIILTIIVYNQIQFMKNKDIGYRKSGIFSVVMQGDSKYNAEIFKNELLRNPDIESVTSCSTLPVNIPFRNTGRWEGMEEDRIMHFAYLYTDKDFFDTFGITLSEGQKDFSGNKFNDNIYFLNETAVKIMELDSPLGKTFILEDKPGKIAGIVKDFHFQSLEYPIRPLVISLNKNAKRHYTIIKFNERSDEKEVISYAHTSWNNVNPGFSFENQFIEDIYAGHYKSESILGLIIAVFSFLSIVISCLGVLGLTNSKIQNRMKEIGIRKVLGSNVAGIIGLLVKDTTRVVIISFIISIPVSYYISSEWLSGYAYRITVKPWFFVLAFIIVYTTVILITAYYVIKAARLSPIEILHTL
jgi:ABC-type antimicrobial peptide transport system permease subunit